jgi:ribonuclease G
MKKILISADPYETRVAIIEEDVVVETYVERATRRSLLGNVYLGRVDNVLPGMEAAFIDVGLEKNGFLYVDEIVLPELEDRERRKKKIEELIRPKQSVLVQVVKDPMGTKGARVTMDVSLAGRFLVYTPDGKGYGVSKRLPDGERTRLRDLVKQLEPRNGGGLIVRTAARGAQREELERDLELLEQQWEAIQKLAKARGTRSPALIHEEVDLALEMVRDDLRVEVDEVITDDEVTYERIRAYVEQHSPEFLPRIKLHTAQTPLMRRYQVEEAIRSTMHRRVELPSGGYLLVDYAEAFTIIDVNTGRFVGKSRLEDTILKNNLEAAREVVRQLRLRDIGGMIVIDFIDMATAKNRDAVIQCLSEELKRDRSKVYLTSISPLGLVEMTRQNVTDGVREVMTSVCPICHGEGRVLSDESIAIENLRTLRRHARLSQSEAFLVELNPRIAALMVGAGGSRLQELERSTGKHFSLVGVEGVPVERCAVSREGRASEILAEALPVTIGQELELEVHEPHMFQAADAVSFLDSGYRIVIAGAGPYLGETHRVKIANVGRLEAIATLLDATPVTEEEMLAMIDRRTDILEPERRTMARIDLEERSRRPRRSKKAAADGIALDGVELVVEEAPAAEGDGEPAGAKRRRRRKKPEIDIEPGTPVDMAVEDVEAVAEDGADDDDEPASENGDGAQRRRRRGRRGGRRHRARRERAAAVAAGQEEPGAVAVADPLAERAREPEPAADPEPAPRRRTRTRKATPAEPVVEAVAEPETPVAEEPAPKRRRTRAKVAPAEPEAAAAEPAPPEPAPKPRRSRTRKPAPAETDG